MLEMEVVGVVDGGGGPPPGHVVHGPEESDLAVHPPVGLHTLEQLLGVVEHLVTGSEQLVKKKRWVDKSVEVLRTFAPGCTLKFPKGSILGAPQPPSSVQSIVNMWSGLEISL